MKKQNSPQSTLDAYVRRRSACDALLMATVLFTVVSVALVYYSAHPVDGRLAAVFSALESAWLGLAAGYATLHVVKPLLGWVRESVFPEWVIEQCADVVKVHGSIALIKWRAVERRLLSTRKNLMLVENAFEQYGCTMAAVPATEAHLAARAQLSALGFAS